MSKTELTVTVSGLSKAGKSTFAIWLSWQLMRLGVQNNIKDDDTMRASRRPSMHLGS